MWELPFLKNKDLNAYLVLLNQLIDYLEGLEQSVRADSLPFTLFAAELAPHLQDLSIAVVDYSEHIAAKVSLQGWDTVLPNSGVTHSFYM